MGRQKLDVRRVGSVKRVRREGEGGKIRVSVGGKRFGRRKFRVESGLGDHVTRADRELFRPRLGAGERRNCKYIEILFFTDSRSICYSLSKC